MKKTFLLGLGALLAAGTANAQEISPVRITSGFNADVVTEALPANEHLTLGVDNEYTGFLVNGVTFVNDRGLPADGAITSNNGNKYQLYYRQRNALNLKGANGDAGTLVFTEPISGVDGLWLLGISANGESKLSVVVNYRDGTSENAQEITYVDWWNSDTGRSFEAVSKLDRLHRNESSFSQVDKVHLDEYKVNADDSKAIVSVAITRVSGGQPFVMGVSTGDEAVEVASGFTDDVVAEVGGDITAVTTATIDNDYVLFAKDSHVNDFTVSGSLPEDNQFTTASGVTYNIDYTGLNAARLGDGSRTITLAVGGTVSEEPDQKYEKLYFLGTAGSGPQTIQATINYTDGSTSTGSFAFGDWYRDTPEGTEALYGLLRTVNYTIDNLDSRPKFRLFEAELDANPRKVVASITLSATGGTPIVMGVSGLPASDDSGVAVYVPLTDVSGWNADIFVEGEKEGYSEAWLDNQGWALYTRGFQVDGAVAGLQHMFTTVGGNKYILGQYADANNALVLNARGNASIEAQKEGTLTFAEPFKADAVTFVGMTGDGAGSVKATVNYVDGKTTSQSFDFGDWCSGSDHAIDGIIRRLRLSDGYVDNDWNISTSECVIPTDNSIEIKSITFEQQGAVPVIFALGKKVTVYDMTDENAGDDAQTLHKLTGAFNAAEFEALDGSARATAYDLTEVTGITADFTTANKNTLLIVTAEQQEVLGDMANVLVHQDGLLYQSNNIELTDDGGDLYGNNGQDIVITAARSSYSRMVSGNYGTVLFPMQASVPEGFAAYELVGEYEENTQELRLMFNEHVGDLSQSRPYVLKVTDTSNNIDGLCPMNITATTEVRISEDFPIAYGEYVMHPSYKTFITRSDDSTPLLTISTDPNYDHSVNPQGEKRPLFQVCDGEIGPFRAYMTVPSDVLASAKQIVVEFSDATGIRRATTEEIEQLFNVYSIDGRLVKQGAASSVGLPQGIYVVNGKKVVVK